MNASMFGYRSLPVGDDPAGGDADVAVPGLPYDLPGQCA